MKLFQRAAAVLLCLIFAFMPLGVSGEFDPESPEGVASSTDGEEIIATPAEPAEPEEPAEPVEPEEPSEPENPEKSAPELTLSDKQATLSVGSEIKIKAELKDFEAPSQSIVWSSDNTAVATVDSRGVVKAVSAGYAIITAQAAQGEETVSASCSVSVTKRRNFFHRLLMIGYRFSNMGDYYYSDNDYAWQKPFGFMRLYDTASQLIGYRYDFTRMVFTYGDKDWLVEFWKGQYAPFQFGGEIGVYTKPAVGFGDTPVSSYRCPAKSDWLSMEMTLYHRLSDGSVRREFTREYDKYWWCDGYRIGRLNKSKPAEELQMVSRITLKDEKMALAFIESMKSCGFKQVDSRDEIKDDTFFNDGCDVYFIWRNLTESQHLIPVMLDGDGNILTALLSGLRFIGSIFLEGLGAFAGND